MWTLFDPLVKPVNLESEGEKALRVSAGKQRAHVPSTLERLWCLLEPTSPLSCRMQIPVSKGN